MQIDQKRHLAGKQTSYLWTHWKNDPLPIWTDLADWHVEICKDVQGDTRGFVAKLSNIPVNSVESRYQRGHRLFIAYLDQTIVAYGWVAPNTAEFSSPTLLFAIPAGNLYLYHFTTMLRWRGRGFYPRLLHAIMLHEQHQYERFWIMHQLSNQASQHGIGKASFHRAGSIFQRPEAGPFLVPDSDMERAQAGAALLGIPLHADASLK